MSETNEKTKDIKYLPIVYTPALVLLPFENQSLKLQTAAHKQLIKDVAHSGKYFGVNFLDKTTAKALDKPETGSVGCIAEVKRIKLSPSGGKIVDVTGVVRYEIGEYVEVEGVPYTVATVKIFEDAPEDEELLRELSREAGSVISRIFEKVLKDKKKSGDEPLAKMNPLLASFLLADLFNMDNTSRQNFLQLRLTSERLKACRENLLRIEDGTDERMTMQQFATPFYSGKHKK